MSELATRSWPRARQLLRIPVATIRVGLAPIALIVAFMVMVGLSIAAAPRRTGDAHQYIAMTLQLSHLRPPSLTPAESSAYRAWLESQPSDSGFPAGARAIRQPGLVRGDRQEFSHFWFYPLLVAPAAGIMSAIDAHPLVAFTITNTALLGAALWATLRAFGSIAALLVVASPIVWFIPRAQVEIFTVSLLTLAISAAATGRWSLASLAVAVASTQNAPIAAAIPLFWVPPVASWLRSRRQSTLPNPAVRQCLVQAFGYPLAATGVALLHPAYSMLQLGVVTPQELNGGIAGAWPTASQYLAPLIDPDIGFAAWMPVTAILTLLGLALLGTSARNASTRHRRLVLATLCGIGMGVWFLFVFSQTTNVNSGGTVHISRYALWLVPLTLPAIATASGYLEARLPVLVGIGAVGLATAYLISFRPDQPERYVEHSPQAAWLMANVPDAYHPLPEIFVERTLHVDGGPSASAADPSCRLILVVAAQTEQPCALTSFEQSQIDERFASGDIAVWVRRDADSRSSVTTAIARS